MTPTPAAVAMAPDPHEHSFGLNTCACGETADALLNRFRHTLREQVEFTEEVRQRHTLALAAQRAEVWEAAVREATNFAGWFPNESERIVTALGALAAKERKE